MLLTIRALLEQFRSTLSKASTFRGVHCPLALNAQAPGTGQISGQDIHLQQSTATRNLQGSLNTLLQEKK